MRYIIIGAGAVGLALSAEFERAGIDYLLIGRGAQLEKLKADGLIYERPTGTQTLRLDLSDRADLREGDVLLLTVKTQDAEAAISFWADQPVEGGERGADLPLVTFQNGLETERAALRRFARVYAASILVPAVYVETGKVSVFSGPQLASVVVGRFPSGRDATSARIVADLTRANSLAEERDDIRRWKAAKLLHNVKNVLELFAGDAATVELTARRIADEARQVLIAAGHDPARPDERLVDITDWKLMRPQTKARTGQSTWQSFTRGARSEVDYLNGEVALLGALHGVPTPWNRAAQRLAAELAAAGGAPGSIAITRLIELAGPDAALRAAS